MHTVEREKPRNSFLEFAERYADEVNKIHDEQLRTGILRIAYDFRMATAQWEEAVLSRVDASGAFNVFGDTKDEAEKRGRAIALDKALIALGYKNFASKIALDVDRDTDKRRFGRG